MQHVTRRVEYHPPIRDDILAVTRKEVFQRRSAGREEEMDVTPLRNASAGNRFVWEGVSLDYSDRLKIIREYSCSEQPGHARPHHHCMPLGVTDLVGVVSRYCC
jgi:hypothetical protein